MSNGFWEIRLISIRLIHLWTSNPNFNIRQYQRKWAEDQITSLLGELKGTRRQRAEEMLNKIKMNIFPGWGQGGGCLFVCISHWKLQPTLLAPLLQRPIDAVAVLFLFLTGCTSTSAFQSQLQSLGFSADLYSITPSAMDQFARLVIPPPLPLKKLALQLHSFFINW